MSKFVFTRYTPSDFTDFWVNFFDFGINLSKMGGVSLSILGFTYIIGWNFLSEEEMEDLTCEMVKQIKLRCPKKVNND